MALDETALFSFLKELLRASKDLKSREIILNSEWIYDLPTQSLSISNNMLHLNYNIPTGWDGYGEKDLEKLVELGYIRKVSESKEDPITFEKTIKYQIIKTDYNKEIS